MLLLLDQKPKLEPGHPPNQGEKQPMVCQNRKVNEGILQCRARTRIPDNKASVLRHGAAKTIPPTTVDDTTEKPEANEAKRPTDNDPRHATDSGTDSLPPLYTSPPAERYTGQKSES